MFVGSPRATRAAVLLFLVGCPVRRIFESFDMLLLIQKGGRTTFFGPLGDHSSTLIDYLMAVPGEGWVYLWDPATIQSLDPC